MSTLPYIDAHSVNRHSVMIVEDDVQLAAMISEFLTPHGFDVRIVNRGDTAVKRILADSPEAVILDVNLPGLDGFGVCRAVREAYAGAIIMLTARGGETDEVLGLEAGADDYLSKPVRPHALLARLKTHLRRALVDDQAISKPIVVGSLTVDAGRRTVALAGHPIELTSAEFDLLKLLADHAGQTLTRNDIHLAIHGIRYDGQDRSIDLRISRLRKKLGDDSSKPQRIKSIRGTGYQLSIES